MSKGSKRRPSKVSEKVVAERWAATFGSIDLVRPTRDNCGGTDQFKPVWGKKPKPKGIFDI